MSISRALELEIDRTANVAIIRASGYLNRQASDQIAARAAALSSGGVGILMVDLSGILLANVLAIERLLAIKRRLARAGVTFTLIGLTPTLEKVLALMGLDPR